MLSIIICSANDERFSGVSSNLASLLRDTRHEIIRISDARSLGEGYTRGIAQSRGEVLIFCHDDIEIITPDFSARLAEHLSRFDLVGVAGTQKLIGSEWASAGHPYIAGQIAQVHPSEGFVVHIFGVHGRSAGSIQAMDGLFFAARRHVVEKVPFDFATFDGFHHYDLDFTYSAYLAGFRLGVANNIHIIHTSSGTHDEIWRRYADRFMDKYRGRLRRQPPRPFQAGWIHVPAKRDVVEVMNGNCQVSDFRIAISI